MSEVELTFSREFKEDVDRQGRIEDVTPLVKKLAALRREGDFDRAAALLPLERVYG